MKKVIRKISHVLKTVFGYIMMITLFAGCLLFLLFLAALLVGGETAAAIAAFAYLYFARILMIVTSGGILTGLLSMYLNGETALTPEKRRKKAHTE